jgi:hypothetical protein
LKMSASGYRIGTAVQREYSRRSKLQDSGSPHQARLGCGCGTRADLQEPLADLVSQVREKRRPSATMDWGRRSSVAATDLAEVVGVA